MNRKYFFPVMAITLAAAIYYFSDKSLNNNSGEYTDKPKKDSSTLVKEQSIAPDPATVGTLAIQIRYSDGRIPDTIDGVLNLNRINEDGTEEHEQLYKITSSSAKCEFLHPGKYRIKAVINILDTESIPDSTVITISAAKTTAHVIVIPK
jgi:hypothetical protein